MFSKKHDDETTYMVGETTKAIITGIARGKAPMQLEKIVKRNHNKSHIANFIWFAQDYVHFGGPFSFDSSLSLEYENVIEILIKELYLPYPENIFE